MLLRRRLSSTGVRIRRSLASLQPGQKLRLTRISPCSQGKSSASPAQSSFTKENLRSKSCLLIRSSRRHSSAAELPIALPIQVQYAERQSPIPKDRGRRSSQRAVSRFGCGKPSFIKQTLEMQSEYISATRDQLKDACLARGVWMNS